jgi:hypothetical protein
MAPISVSRATGLRRKAAAPRDPALAAMYLSFTCSDHDGRDADTTVQEFALQLEASHVGHLHIHYQTSGHPGGESLKEGTSRRIVPGIEPVHAQ